MNKYRIRVYKDRSGNWRWSMRSAVNGKIVGAATEGYVRRGRAIANLAAVTGYVVSVGRGHNGNVTRTVEFGQRAHVSKVGLW